MILQISESCSLYLFVNNSFNFKLDFFTYFEYISGGFYYQKKQFMFRLPFCQMILMQKRPEKPSKNFT